MLSRRKARALEQRVAALEAERTRLREAFTRFGESLAATHEPERLSRVVVEAAVEATGAHGAMLVGDEGELVEVGNPHRGSERLALPLAAGRTTFGTLTLSGDGFDDDDRMTATSIAAHAAVALENARLHRIVEQQALVDGVTGLANRRQCEATLAAHLAHAQRVDESVALVLLDLDGLKDVNDRHGHQTGDAVLRELARVLLQTAREADLAGRWGGDEFVLICPGTTTFGGVQLAARVCTELRTRTVPAPDGKAVPVSASFGVASYPDAAGEEALLAAADAALYSAKRQGKNRVACAEPASVAA